MVLSSWLRAITQRLARRNRLEGRRRRLNSSILGSRCELLATRVMLSAFDVSAGALNIDINVADQGILVTSAGTSYNFLLTSGTWDGTDDSNVTGHGTSVLTVSSAGLATLDSINITDSAAGAGVTFQDSGSSAYSDNINITLDVGASEAVQFSGSSSFAASNSIHVTTTDVIVFGSGASLTTADGNVTLSANRQATSTSGNFHGISIPNATIQATGAGNVTLEGSGGNGTFGDNDGVWISGSGSLISSNTGNVSVTGTGGGTGTGTFNLGVRIDFAAVITAGSGTVSIVGQGGNLTGDSWSNVGVAIWRGSLVTSGGGNVSVTGTGGGSGTNSFNNNGVDLELGGQIIAGPGGTVTVVGQGGTSGATGDTNHGVNITNVNSKIASNGGNISVTGTGGGTGESRNNFGVAVTDAGQITAGLNGTVTVVGQGGTGSSGYANHGIYVAGTTSSITSDGGDVSLSGTGGGLLTSPFNFGIEIFTGGLISAGGSGNVSLTGYGGNQAGTGQGNYGVVVTGTNTLVTSNGGNVSLTGFGGGASTSYSNHGVDVEASGQVTAGGNGSVSIVGYGGNLTGNAGTNAGVSVTLGGIITSSGGDVSVTGTGGGAGASSDGNAGVTLGTGGEIRAGLNGAVTVVGHGGNLAGSGNNNTGVNVAGANSKITSSGGTVSVTGTGGGTGTSANNFGVAVTASAEIGAGGLGTLNVIGYGGSLNGTGQTNFGVFVREAGSKIMSSGGNVSVTGTGGGTGSSVPNSGIHIGVDVDAGAVISSISGNVAVNGTGGGAGSAANNWGVAVQGAAQITSGAGGTVTVIGHGGNLTGTGGSNYGIAVTNANSTITSGGGNVSVTGTGGGGGNTTLNRGVLVNVGKITAGSSGTVTVVGQGGTGTTGDSNRGVAVQSAGRITSSGGNVSVTGTGGGTGISSGNIGVAVPSGQITAGGTGTVTVIGQGGNLAGTGNNSYGVLVSGATSTITSGGGDVLVTGIEGGGNASLAVVLMTSGAITTATNGGAISLIGDSMYIDATSAVAAQSLSNVTLRQRTAGVEINLGAIGDTAGGPLSLSDAELDQITAGTITIGDSNTGRITLSSSISRSASTNFVLATAAATGVSPIASATDLSLAGGALTFASGAALTIDVTGAMVDTQYNQLQVTGTVDVTGVDLELTGSYIPVPGDVFTIVSATTVTGTFNGLPNHSTIVFNGRHLKVNYTSTAVTLTMIPSVSFDSGREYASTDPSNDFTSGTVVVGDFNNDNILDMAATSSTAVSVFLGIGAGEFGVPIVFSLSAGGGNDLVTADVTGDGILDLAIGVYTSHIVDVFAGVGDGTFTPYAQVGVGNVFLTDIVAGDFDNDGDIDLASGGRGSGGFDAVGIIQNNSNTSLNFAGWVIASGWPSGLATGDFNEDGIVDLAISEYTSHSVTIMLSNGDLTFTRYASLAGPYDLSSVDVGYIDSDDHLDVVATNLGDFSPPGDRISIFYGDGTGNFSAGQVLITNDRPIRTTIADVNGDNNADLLVAVFNSQTIDVFLGDGERNYVTSNLYHGGPGSSVIAADADANGTNDLFVGNNGSSNMISVYLNQNTPLSGDPTANAGGTYHINEGDSLTLNGTSSSDPNRDSLNYVWDLNGDGIFGDAYGVSPVISAARLAQLGIDGRAALYTVSLKVDDRRGHVSPIVTTTLRVDNLPPVITGSITGPDLGTVGQSLVYAVSGFVDPGPLDTHTTTWEVRDSNLQLVASGTGLSINFIPATADTFTIDFNVQDDEGASDAARTTVTVIPGVLLSSPTPFGTDATSGSVISGDFNADGIIDVAVTSGAEVNVFLGDGAGNFETRVFALTIGDGGTDIVAADLNGDGVLDLAVATYIHHTVDILFGNIGVDGHADGNFTLSSSPIDIPAELHISGIVAADFDCDGDVDLAASGRGPNPSGFDAVAILQNDGFGHLSFVNWAIPAGWPVELATGDFNEDGILDIATADYTSHSVSILLGNADPLTHKGNLTFTRYAVLGTPYDLSDVVVGDIDGDSHLDLVATNVGELVPPGDRLSIFYGDGDGNFAAPEFDATLVTSDRPSRTIIADINGDGEQDLLVGTYGGQTIDIFLGLGGRRFVQQPSISTGPTASLLAIDVDHNGTIDVVSANNHTGNFSTISVFLNLGPHGNVSPTFTAGPNITVEEDAGPQTIAGWATGISAGSLAEAGQHVTFVITCNSNPEMFTTLPQISADGTLTFETAPDAHGSATITFFLQDDGGTNHGGFDRSVPHTFRIVALQSVTDVNPASNSVAENSSIGSTVGITASAPLAGTYDTVTYALENNAGKPFSIDPITGVVTVAGPINYEAISSYTLDIAATRTSNTAGYAPLTVRTSIAVSILDVAEGFSFSGTPGNDTIKISPVAGMPQYFYFKLNSASPVMQLVTDYASIYGGGGTDTLVIEGDATANQFDIHADQIQFGDATFFDHQITTRNVNSLALGDTIRVFDGNATVNGGSAADTLIAMSATNHTWTLTGANSGNLDNQVTFTSVEKLVGGSADDAFNFESGGSVSGLIDGGSGSDKLNYTNVTTSISVNLQTSTATKTGGFSNIEQFVGGTAIDTFVGANTANQWTLTGIGIGNVNDTQTYDGFENLTGGSQLDTFVLGDSKQIVGNLSGGGGSDVVEYQTNTDLNVNLATSTASLIGGTFSSISQFQMGGGTDTVIGRNVANNFAIAGTKAVTAAGISFTNVERMTGGAAIDTVTGNAVTNFWNLTDDDQGSIPLLGLSWSGVENLTGGTQIDTFALLPDASVSGTINGGGGVDVLDYTSRVDAVSIDLSAGAGTDLFHFTSLEAFRGSGNANDAVQGANNSNTWTITPTGGTVDGSSLSSFEVWRGGTLTDTLVGLDLATDWYIDGNNSGHVSGVRFEGIENLTGKTQVDTFFVQGVGRISGVINGGTGTDVLDFSGATGPVTVNLANNSASNTSNSIVGTLSSITALVGSAAGGDTLIGADNANVWNMTSAISGSVDGVAFRDFESLVGGSAVDTFRPNAASNYTGIFDGGAGVDKLDYAAFTGSVLVNLSLGVATGIGGVTNVESLTGGDGNDVLIGNSLDNVISGGNGDDILIGLGGNDSLAGGNGRDFMIAGFGTDLVHGNNTEDILIGGTTTYVNESTGVVNQTALDALMAEWRRTDLAYLQRIAHLNGSVTTGQLNGTYVISAATVIDDETADQLFGDSGLDWFLSGTGDTISSTAGERVDET